MPSAARNIKIEVHSSSYSAVFLGVFLLLVAAFPVRLLLAERLLPFLLPPFAFSRLSFRVPGRFPLLRSSPRCFRPCLDPSYSVASSACMRGCCAVPPFSTFLFFGTSLSPVLASLSGRTLHLLLFPVFVLPLPFVRLLSLLACFICRLLFVCVYAVLSLSCIPLCAPLPSPQIRSRRIRGVSRVTPPDERAPLPKKGARENKKIPHLS